MKGLLQIALGVIAAIGGFVDIGDLVFNSQAGASVGTPALWATPVGVLGIIVFAEMSGRIVAVSKKPNFVLVKERYGPRLSAFTLVASLVLTVLTLGAELGGLGFVLNYFFDVSVSFFVLVALVVAAAAMRPTTKYQYTAALCDSGTKPRPTSPQSGWSFSDAAMYTSSARPM